MRRARERELEREHRQGKRRAGKAALAAGAATGATVLFAPAAAQAATFTVDTLADTPPDGCGPAPDECTLREAVYAANATPEADTITFASGLSGTIELNPSYGDIRIEDAMTIEGPGAGTITVDGTYNDRIFYVDTADTDPVTISGLTMRDGYAELYSGPYTSYPRSGGAVYGSYDSGPLTIVDAVVADSRASGDGGGIAVLYTAGLTLTNTQVRDNDANSDGGGVYADGTDVTISGSTVSGNEVPGGEKYGYAREGGGVYSDEGTLTIDSSTIARNYAGEGGGVYVDDTDETAASGVVIRDSEISDNIAAEEGGGVYLDSIDSPSRIERATIAGNVALYEGGGVLLDSTNTDYDAAFTISESTITDNTSAEEGGGVYLDDPDDPVTIERTTVADNVALDDGGGVHLDDTEGDATFLLDKSTVSGNEAQDGGGVYLDLDNPGTIRNSTISGNYASDRGGGVYVDQVNTLYDNTGELHLDSSTINGNSVEGTPDESSTGVGGAIYRDNFGLGDVEISSSILANSSGAADLGEDTYEYNSDDGGEFVIGFSLIEDPGDTTFREDPAGSNITGQDPQLGPLQDNGGPTETHAPAPGSPVIDAGISNGLATDQRGEPRTVDRPEANAEGSDGTDMGSVELARAPAPPPPPPAGATANCQGQTVNRTNGTEGDDTITGTDLADSIFGLGGDDVLKGVIGPDCLDGGPGTDILKGGGGKDLLKGGGGKDKLRGQGGKDKLRGQDGRDKLVGGEGRDKLAGGEGRDKLRGGPAKDRIKGNGGPDKINAVDNKRDRVNCGAGEDEATVDEIDKVKGNCETVVEVDAK